MGNYVRITDQKVWLTLFSTAYESKALGLSLKLPANVLTVGIMEILYRISTEYFYDLVDMQRVGSCFVLIYGIEGTDKFGY